MFDEENSHKKPKIPLAWLKIQISVLSCLMFEEGKQGERV